MVVIVVVVVGVVVVAAVVGVVVVAAAAYAFIYNGSAMPAILELGFLATSRNACCNRTKSWTCPTTAY